VIDQGYIIFYNAGTRIEANKGMTSRRKVTFGMIPLKSPLTVQEKRPVVWRTYGSWTRARSILMARMIIF